MTCECELIGSDCPHPDCQRRYRQAKEGTLRPVTPKCSKCSCERFKYVREYTAAEEWNIRSVVWNTVELLWEVDVDSSKVASDQYLEVFAETIECVECDTIWFQDRQGYSRTEGHDQKVSFEWN